MVNEFVKKNLPPTPGSGIARSSWKQMYFRGYDVGLMMTNGQRSTDVGLMFFEKEMYLFVN